MHQRIWIAGLTIFIIDIILWVITLVAVILACLNAAKWNKLVKGLLIFACILLFGVSIAFLYYMWGIAAISGSCGLVKEIVKGNAKVLKDVNADADVSRAVV